MLMPPPARRSRVIQVAGLLALFACVLIGLAAFDTAYFDLAWAQGNPFGAGRTVPPSPGSEGIVGWLLTKQSEFYRSLSALIRAAKTDGSAVYGLLGLSFAYGVFHAAGPGHGKAVISSYLVANEETWRRGVVLSFASSLLQSLVAVALVGIMAALLGATAKVMGDTVRMIETASYLLIVAIGMRLTWIKGKAFLTQLRPVQHHHAHDHDHHDHHHDHDHAHHHHEGDACAHCGHSHGPEPDQLAGPAGWQRGFSAILAVGLRPCSGAILVLVFALSQGLFWTGIAATFVMGLGTAMTVTAIAILAVGARSMAKRMAESRSGAGTLILRGLETAAGMSIVVFGTLLLLGYMASERLFAV
jgi:ABC-type nickel/cobalt efflux system permease component RcnA